VYFGSFLRSMFSMFELTLANWPPAARILAEYVHWSFMPLAVAHKLVFGFVVIGVITGVIMKETFKVAEQDNQIMVWQKERQVQMHTRKMKAFFAEADTSNDGTVTLQEFRDIMEVEWVRTWLASMDMSAGDIDQLFKLIDTSQDGLITVEELIKSVSKLKGAARSIDLVTMMDEQFSFFDQVRQQLGLEEEAQADLLEVGSKAEGLRGNDWEDVLVLQVCASTVRVRWDSDGWESALPRPEVRAKVSTSEALGRRRAPGGESPSGLQMVKQGTLSSQSSSRFSSPSRRRHPRGGGLDA